MIKDIPAGMLHTPLIDPSANKRNKINRRTYKQQMQLEHNIIFKDANNRIEDGIAKTRDMFFRKKLWIFRDLTNTIAEGCEYRYPTLEERNNNRNIGDLPIDKNNHCLTGDTLVHTTDGLIPIKDLVGKEGQVYCYDEQTGKKTVSTFSDVRKTRKNAELIKIETDKGVIKCTPDHLILTTDGWVEAGNLTEKSLIISIIQKNTAQKNAARVLKITKINNEDVYNMEVEKYHNFAVNDGLIVHNCMDCLRYICQEVPYDYIDSTRLAINSIKSFFGNMGYRVLESNKRAAANKRFDEIAQNIVDMTRYEAQMAKNNRCSGGYKI